MKDKFVESLKNDVSVFSLIPHNCHIEVIKGMLIFFRCETCGLLWFLKKEELLQKKKMLSVLISYVWILQDFTMLP